MVSSLTYRTADGTRWGGGNGSDLAAVQVDLNFWTLFSALDALESHVNSSAAAGIDFINQPSGGNIFYIHLTDHRVLGPFTIPTSEWNPRGAWQPNTAYAPFDVFYENGSLYIVTIAHTTGDTFNVNLNDGMGHNYYVLLLVQPTNQLPEDGTVGQRLAKSAGSPFATEWVSDRVRMYEFVAGQPDPGELIMQYPVVDFMTIPVGLANSVIFEGTPSIGPCSWTLFKNGSSIGSIDFSGSPEAINVSVPSDVHCVPGDIITLVAPTVPDAGQANVSFTIVALLTS